MLRTFSFRGLAILCALSALEALLTILERLPVTEECQLPRFWSRPKLSYDQTQSSAHPCVPRPKLQGLESGSSAQKSGQWSDFGLIRGQLGLDGLIIVFIVWSMVWVRSAQRSIRSGRSDHSLYSLDHGLGSVCSEVNSVWKV